jgi:hypothetical protein
MGSYREYVRDEVTSTMGTSLVAPVPGGIGNRGSRIDG